MSFSYPVLSRLLVFPMVLCFVSACIEDTPIEMGDPAVLTVRVAATPYALTEAEQTVLTVTLTLSETPLDGGIDVSLESGIPNALAQFDLSAAIYNGATLAEVNADASGLTLNVSAQTATIHLPVTIDDLEEQVETFTYTLTPSEVYAIDPAANAFSVTISDRPPEFLSLGITASPAELIETEQTEWTLTIRLSEAPPADGVDVTIDGGLPGALDDLDLSAAVYNGAELRSTAADASGLTLHVVEQTATVTLPVLNDGLSEGEEMLTLMLEPSEDYTIDPAASAVSVAFLDLSPNVLTVGITAAPTDLIESERTAFTITISLSQPPPADGVNVTIASDMPNTLRELDVLATVFVGARLVAGNAERSGLTLNVFEPTATLTTPVFDDRVPEGPEILTFDLQPSEAYTIDPAASSIRLTIFDAAP
jgi:hypothetical protein